MRFPANRSEVVRSFQSKGFWSMLSILFKWCCVSVLIHTNRRSRRSYLVLVMKVTAGILAPMEIGVLWAEPALLVTGSSEKVGVRRRQSNV